jgi:hypothetical protein
MATRESTRPDLGAILGCFAEARAVIETSCKALESAEERESGDAVLCLRTGLAMLDAAYDALDLAIARQR